MDTVHSKLKQSLTVGAKKGWGGFIWMLKIIVPISFLTILLEYSGWINKINFILEPCMDFLSLSPIASIPLIFGMLTGIYGGIAAMVVLPLTTNEMTLIAIFLLISHNLVQEGIIQSQSGLKPFKATIFRLAASIVTVMMVSIFLEAEPAQIVAKGASEAIQPVFIALIRNWLIATIYLSIKILVIIMVIMILIEIMKIFNMIPHIVKIMNPLLIVMGLDKRVGVLWLTATVFGVAYGGAVIVEEVKEEKFTKKELERLHLSIGINHSMVEDPALFLALGISAFWLWVPRFITAVVAVRLFDLYYKIKY